MKRILAEHQIKNRNYAQAASLLGRVLEARIQQYEKMMERK
jgi:hypothetical protein